MKESEIAAYREKELYIHRSWQNITNASDIVQRLQEDQERLSRISFSRYQSNYLSNLTLSEDAIGLIEQAEDPDKIIREIDKAFGEAVQTELEKSLQNALSMEDFESALGKGYEILVSQEHTGFQNLKRFIEAVEQCSKMLTESNVGFKTLLANIKSTNTTTRIINALDKYLANLEKETKDTPIRGDVKAAQRIAIELKKIAEKVKENPPLVDENGKKINPYTKMIQKIFSDNLSELQIAAHLANMTDNAENYADLWTALDRLDMSSPSVAAQFKDRGNSEKNPTFKTDAGGVSLALDFSSGELGGNISMELGVSVKAYKGAIGGKEVAIKIADEKNLSYRLIQYAQDAQISEALVGNVFIHRNEEGAQAWNVLKRNIALRNLDYLFAGGIGKDFSQYLIINTKLYSIYDILSEMKELVQRQTINGRESEGIITVETPRDDGKNSISDSAKKDISNAFLGYVRSTKYNEPAIKTTHFLVHFHPKRYLNYKALL